MQLNHDQTQRTLVHGASLPWTSSPANGVQRRMLYREGEEKARATSIVRYEPGSTFPPHEHPEGEEFLVLEGTFQDERGNYPAGTYVRNPPGSSHAPASAEGCVIFVRLKQFDKDDSHECMVHLENNGDPAATQILFSSNSEKVTFHRCPAGAAFRLANSFGLELLVLSGTVEESGDLLQTSAWLRLPPGAPLQAIVGSDGARLWIKRKSASPSPAASF
jgi:quercetin dioxygenase-like cupin family protein